MLLVFLHLHLKAILESFGIRRCNGIQDRQEQNQMGACLFPKDGQVPLVIVNMDYMMNWFETQVSLWNIYKLIKYKN